jgi:hypothetical protein
MKSSRNAQRVGGLLIAAVGAGFTAWVWRESVTTGYFSVRAALTFPAFFVVGFALMLFPGYKEERRARGEDLMGVTGWRLITTRWWLVLLLAFACGFANLWLLQR